MTETTLRDVLTNPETYENVSRHVSRPIPEKEEGKAYALRALEAGDVFTMSKILKSIGVQEFKGLFVNNYSAFTSDSEEEVVQLGLEVFLDIAGIVLGNLPKCEGDVYAFISSLSGMKEEEIKHLPMNTFLDIIVDIISKEEFKDFMKVVSKLFK